MARKGRVDRGLYQRPDAHGKLHWHVRLMHEGKDCRFGSFPTKTKARDFYDRSKVQQVDGKFFPERYQRGLITVEGCIASHLATTTVKRPQTERNFGKWWVEHCGRKKLHTITPKDLEAAQRKLFKRTTPLKQFSTT